MNIPLETVMRLPVQDRRYYIFKHNEEQEGIRTAREKEKNVMTFEGEALNAYARNEQENIKNRSRGG